MLNVDIMLIYEDIKKSTCFDTISASFIPWTLLYPNIITLGIVGQLFWIVHLPQQVFRIQS